MPDSVRMNSKIYPSQSRPQRRELYVYLAQISLVQPVVVHVQAETTFIIMMLFLLHISTYILRRGMSDSVWWWPSTLRVENLSPIEFVVALATRSLCCSAFSPYYEEREPTKSETHYGKQLLLRSVFILLTSIYVVEEKAFTRPCVRKPFGWFLQRPVFWKLQYPYLVVSLLVIIDSK